MLNNKFGRGKGLITGNDKNDKIYNNAIKVYLEKDGVHYRDEIHHLRIHAI